MVQVNTSFEGHVTYGPNLRSGDVAQVLKVGSPISGWQGKNVEKLVTNGEHELKITNWHNRYNFYIYIYINTVITIAYTMLEVYMV